MKIFRTQEDHAKYFEAFPNSGGLIIFPCDLEGFPNEAWVVGYSESVDENEVMGIFANIKDAYFYAIAWNNSDVFDIDYDDIRYVGD
jgi:hypothetical protein